MVDEKERRRISMRNWHARNPGVNTERHRLRRKAAPEEVHAYYRMYYYGLTKEQYDHLVLAYGGRCPLCCREKPLVIDHDHSTGKVRGLLCLSCNLLLGQAERGDWLSRAREYLEKTS